MSEIAHVNIQGDAGTLQIVKQGSGDVAFVYPANIEAVSALTTAFSTTSTTAVMAGAGLTFTPKKGSGIVKVALAAVVSNATASDGVKAQIAYGTGSAPAAGAAATGTAVGDASTFTSAAANAAGTIPLTVVITGLTPGVTYWIDLQVAAVTGGTASVGPVYGYIEEA
jgi:hypothetical protein